MSPNEYHVPETNRNVKVLDEQHMVAVPKENDENEDFTCNSMGMHTLHSPRGMRAEGADVYT